MGDFMLENTIQDINANTNRLENEVLFLESRINDLNRIIKEKDRRLDELLFQIKTFTETIDLLRNHTEIQRKYIAEVEHRVATMETKKNLIIGQHIQDAIIDY